MQVHSAASCEVMSPVYMWYCLPAVGMRLSVNADKEAQAATNISRLCFCTVRPARSLEFRYRVLFVLQNCPSVHYQITPL